MENEAEQQAASYPSLSPFFFDDYTTDANLIKYYIALDNRHAIPNYRWYKEAIYRHFPVLIHKKNMVRFLHDIDVRCDLQKPSELLKKEQLKELAEKRISDWNVQAHVDVSKGIVSQEAYGVRKRNEKVFSEIVELACRNRVEVIIVIPPFTDVFNSKISDSFIEDEYEGFLSLLAKKHGLKLYNYREDERFSSHYEFFRNADCLNGAGARKFTDIIVEEVLFDDSNRGKKEVYRM